MSVNRLILNIGVRIPLVRVEKVVLSYKILELKP